MKAISKIKYFLFGSIISILATLLVVEKGYYFSNYNGYVNPTKTDTIHTNTVYKEIKIEPKEIAVPYEVKIYKTDTVYREQLENDTLISSVVLNKKQAEIHTLTPSGTPLINTYPVKNFSQIQINHKGQANIKLQKHSKRIKALKWLGRIGLFVGGTFIGSQIKQ